MGFLTDLFKEIPLSAVLKEKIAAFENENAALKTENAILKDDKRQLEAENKRLKDEIQRLTHTADLHENEIQILADLAEANELVDASDLEQLLNLPATRVKYHMDNLEKQGYVEGRHFAGELCLYSLTPKGRAYAVENNLI